MQIITGRQKDKYRLGRTDDDDDNDDDNYDETNVN